MICFDWKINLITLNITIGRNYCLTKFTVSSSRDEIALLLETVHQQERVSSENKAEMAFKIMDRSAIKNGLITTNLFR